MLKSSRICGRGCGIAASEVRHGLEALSALLQLQLSTNESLAQLRTRRMPEVFQLMLRTQLGAHSSSLHMVLADVAFAMKVFDEVVCLQRLRLPRDELGVPLFHTLERHGIGLAASAILLVRASFRWSQGELAALLVMTSIVALIV